MYSMNALGESINLRTNQHKHFLSQCDDVLRNVSDERARGRSERVGVMSGVREGGREVSVVSPEPTRRLTFTGAVQYGSSPTRLPIQGQIRSNLLSRASV